MTAVAGAEGLYRGRFAPAPSGPLHLGSLLTAVASWLEAKARQGEWLLRIEDIDRQRCRPWYEQGLVAMISAHGLRWSAPPLRQSERRLRYLAAVDRLLKQGDAYPCDCSRSELLRYQMATGTKRCLCAQRRRSIARPHCLRLVTPRVATPWFDAIQGQQNEGVDQGDMVLRHGDDGYTYHLAAVVDDAEQGVSHIVRGADLMASTAAQLALQQCLGYPRPYYAHLPLLVSPEGHKWSKQTAAPALKSDQAAAQLINALTLLGQSPPWAVSDTPLPTVNELLTWARAHWSLARVPRCRELTVALTD